MLHLKQSKKHPFKIDAIGILPDHFHYTWTLPENDSDYSTRRNLIKGSFSRSFARNESLSTSRVKRRKRGIWQRRFWEHRLQDENDLNLHLNYIHLNPVKYGYVPYAID